MSLRVNIRTGLKKIYKKSIDRLFLLKGSRESIAKGVATGAAVSFTPFVGLHILLALIIAKITKQNRIAAVLGTLLGNPWTFPFIWYLTLHTGHFMLGRDAPRLPLDFKIFFSELFHTLIMLDFDSFLSDIWPVLFLMLIGCIPFCIGVWLLVSYFTKRLLARKRIKEEN